MSVSNYARRSVFSIVPIAATPTQLVAANEERTSLTIAAVDADVFISIDSAVTATTGLKIPTAAQATNFCQCHEGAFVKERIMAVTGGGTHNVAVIEGFEPVGDQER